MEKQLHKLKVGKPPLPTRDESQPFIRDLNMTIHHAMHDLRSPLNVVKPYIDFLKKIDDAEKREAILSRMKTAVEKMEVIIDRFVKYSDLICLETPEVKEVTFQNMFEQAYKETHQKYPNVQKEIELRDELKGISFSYPPEYLKSILKILMDNAFKYRSSERTLKIKISATLIHDDLFLEMKDNGMGFPEYFSMEQAFIPFAKNASPAKGTGLGLASLKYMVEQNKGEVYGSSSEDGTAFIIKLKPYPQASKVKKGKADQRSNDIGHKDLSNIARVS